MKKSGVAATLLLLFCLLAILAFVLLPVLMERMAVAKGPVLVYEVDPEFLPKGRTVDMDKLSAVVQRRVNPGPRLAQVRRLDDRRIEVALMRKGAADVERVKVLLASTGTLEFRILANTRDNKDLIDRALADLAKTKILDAKGNLGAWWVAVHKGDEGTFKGYGEIARRTRKLGQREVMEILVVKDVYDVTGAYFTRVDPGTDQRGQPCINLAFSKAGGQLFGHLTGDHLPDRETDFTYKLGIILDDELYSAPSIQSKITDRAEITGSFTRQQVQDLAGVLNSGILPARIRLVE